MTRLSTGIDGLDELLGGGLLPGTLAVVVGASGIGKTQLGLQFAHAALAGDPNARPGIIFDMTARGDPQSHAEYARRMFDWRLNAASSAPPSLEGFFDPGRQHGDYLHVFDASGRRVTQRDVDFDRWLDWQAELSRKLAATIAFFYGNFIHGVRRAVIDGIEPAERASESIQHELISYVYHQIFRKEPTWVARDLFREHYREVAGFAEAHVYDSGAITGMLLVTSQEVMLDDLIGRPIGEGDLLATANTVIYMGKIREGRRLERGLLIAKHRGSAASDEIATFTIGDRGLAIN